MKAISIRQPWAWLILNADKDIENRDWSTKVRGRVLIHAAKSMTRGEYDDAIAAAAVIIRQRSEPPVAQLPFFEELQRGGIVGSVEIAGSVQDSASPWFFGRYGFVLRDPRHLAFVPFKGALGFFEVPDSSVAA